MRKRFTLIELLIVIVVIGILSGVITGNVIDARKKAIISASNQELKNIQLATDIYIIKTNTIPVSEAKPELGRPVLLDIGKLYPEYLKKLPKKEFNYWIDHDNIVWSSSVPLPTDFSKKGNNISWNLDDEVQEYHIYDVENNSLKSIKTIKSNEFTITEFYDNDYAISAFDNYGFQTPPLLIEFSENEIPNLPEVPEPSPTPDNIENTKFREFYFNVYGGKGITTDGEALSWGYNDLEELYLVFNKYREYIPEYFVNTEDGMSFIYFYDIMFFSHIDNNYIEKNYENHLKGYFETSFGMDLPENITNDLKVFIDKVTEEIDDTMKFRATTELDIPNAKEIVSTSNGTYYAILENGTVMTWGSNYNGNLGLGEDDPYLDINTPTLIPSLSNVEKIINKNGETTFAITKNGEIYSWGYNSLRNACHTDVDTISVPTKIDSLSNNSLLVIDDIYQNNRTTFFKMKNGDRKSVV